jgi:hypothetical protein
MSNGASALPSWLASANNAVLVTNGSGIPSLSTTLPSGLTLPGYLPLSGGTMTGALNMGTFGISNMADPSLAQDAVTLTYLQSNYVNLAGSTMTGLLVLSGAPTADLDAATKLYVDQTAAGLAPAGPVEAASTTNFAATYNNGSSGIGATLTATSTGVVTLDGITTVLGGDYLFKNQTTGFQNGIYVCTTAGAVGVAGVFTRSNRYDTPSDINNTGIVPVINGSTQAGQGYYQTSTVVSVGVTPITYINFGSSGTVTSITAGTGLSGGTISTAGTISLTIPVVVSSGGTGLTSTTAYGVMCGGTTTTANLQNTGAGTAGQLFMSNGAAALPSWLATANNSVLVTDGSGTPSLATTLPSGLTIPSPLINTGLYDINGNQILRFTPTASAVDNFEIINNIGGANALGFGAVGTNTDIIVSLYGKGTGRAQIKGTGVNDNVSTGFVGEEMQSVILSSGALVTLANGTAKTMVSLTLTAGDWDIWGNVFFNLSGNGTFVECGISTTTNTLPDTAFIALVQATLPSSQGINAPGYRVSIASTTTYYLIARCGFSTGAATCNGGLYARRRS